MSRRLVAAVVAVLLGFGLLLSSTSTAHAALAGWADFEFGGSSPNFTGTMTQEAAGFPVATITSDSAGGSVGEQTGASTFLSVGTPVEPIYGSSRNRPYLNLRPRQQNAGTSVTTYTFERSTPSSGWTFVLGDIDADEVRITAIGADGQPVDTDDLGFEAAFNYCAPTVSPRPNCQTSQPLTQPTWQPATGTLLGDAPQFRDTVGAAAWFQPTVALTSLTFEYTRRSGFPVYQTWFSALEYDIRGTVDVPTGLDPQTLTLRLYDPEGNQVATTQPGDDGTYSFLGFATYDGYRVALDRPTGYASDDPLSQQVDLSAGDQDDVDFSLRIIEPVSVSGAVLDADDEPVPGVVITLTGPGPDRTVTTGADGSYLLDGVAVGDDYTLTATAPAGTSITGPLTFDVPPDTETPIGDQDFRVTADPVGTAGGSVTDTDDNPRSGVLITVTGPGDAEYLIRTAADGTWALPDLPPGAYTATVTPPDGTDVEGDASLDFTIPTGGGSIDDLDFVLELPQPPPTYAAGGSVTDGQGDSITDAMITVKDPDGASFATATTDDDGNWRVDGLPTGDGWTAELAVPEGYDPVGDSRLTFDITDDDVANLDFVLRLELAPSPSPTPTPTASPTPSPAPSSPADPVPSTDTWPNDNGVGSDGGTSSGPSGNLAATGGPTLGMSALGFLLVTTGGVLWLRCGRPRRSPGVA